MQWQPRSQPLTPCAVVAEGALKQQLTQQLLARADEYLYRLQGVYSDSSLLVLGSTDDLPWYPGVQYLGEDPLAPYLLLPVHVRPVVPVDLLGRAVQSRFGEGRYALLPETGVCLPLEAAREIDRMVLARLGKSS